VAKLIYSAIMSLDGYIEDERGNFDWAFPTDEAHLFINEREREVGTYLLGRRMYETMAVWETNPMIAQQSAPAAEYAGIWQSVDKVVYSRTLESTVTARTRIERDFDPAVVRRLVQAADRDVSIGGAELGAHGFKAGLIDECHLYVVPVIVGRGKPALPGDVFVKLELLLERSFADGMVFLRYRVSPGG
jgi:dihydrofolate reductase